MNQKNYAEITKKRAYKTHTIKNCICAFLIGGTICLFGELLLCFIEKIGIEKNEAKKWVTISLIFLSCLLTGIGWYDNVAKIAGAGTLVPITGFANAMCSPSIDSKSEGFVLGVGAKMFTIAGPVIVYGTVASVVYGVIYWITTLF